MNLEEDVWTYRDDYDMLVYMVPADEGDNEEVLSTLEIRAGELVCRLFCGNCMALLGKLCA